MQSKKIFLASSSELKTHREQFELFIGRKNKLLRRRNIFLELIIWEDFIDAMAKTRLQDKYNEAIKQSDIFVMLFHTKVGPFTAEEFEVAYQTFQQDGKPLVYTYFNNAEAASAISDRDRKSLNDFKEKLRQLGHYKTEYANIEALKYHFSDQLEKLEAEGFFDLDTSESFEEDAKNSGVDLLNKIKGELTSSTVPARVLAKYQEELVKIDPHSENEILLLQAQWNRLEQDTRMGLISNSNATIQRNRLQYSGMQLLDSLARSVKNQ